MSSIGVVDWTDMFCGAGGSSAGIEQIPGHQITQALNHWPLAVEAHNRNFPNADHDVHDVQEIPAGRFRRTRCLWASPDCTHHAYCRGPKAYDPASQRSRSTFGDVVRFTAHHRYDAVVVENVIEARLWCEAGTRKHGWDPKRQEYRCSCGIDFDEWFSAMLALGYEGRVTYFNSQFALPTPQSRDRMYIVFWRKGLRAPDLDFRPPSWCEQCVKVVPGIQTWKTPTRGSIRSQPGKFEWGRYGAQYVYTCPTCTHRVAPAVTGARAIIDWALPAQRIGDRKKDLAPKTRARIRAGLERLATLDPITVQVGGHCYERRPGVRVWSVNDPLRTVTCTAEMALVRYGGQGVSPRAGVEPMQTITAHDRQIGVVIPNRTHNVGAQLELPVDTITTAPAQHMLVQVNRSTKGKPVDRNANTLAEPTRTISGHGELAIVAMRNHANAQHGGEPVPTVCGGGNHHGVLVYNGVPGFVRQIDDSAGTLTARDKQSILAGPAVDVIPLTVTDDDVDDCTFRMLQWHELLRAQVPHDHADGREYELTARRRDARGRMRELSNEERVKLIGNMVSSPVASLYAQAVGDVLATAA